MDSIKKKMQSLARETANATARAEKWEKEVASLETNLKDEVSGRFHVAHFRVEKNAAANCGPLLKSTGDTILGDLR